MRAVTVATAAAPPPNSRRSEEHTSELQSLTNLVCRLLLEKERPDAWSPASDRWRMRRCVRREPKRRSWVAAGPSPSVVGEDARYSSHRVQPTTGHAISR